MRHHSQRGSNPEYTWGRGWQAGWQNRYKFTRAGMQAHPRRGQAQHAASAGHAGAAARRRRCRPVAAAVGGILPRQRRHAAGLCIHQHLH